MPSRPHDPPLPRGWTGHVRSGLLHEVGLAATALTVARGRATATRGRTRRLAAELERAAEEIALLREELAVKDDRWSRLPSKRRPHFSETERMRVLALRAARGWSLADAAARLLVNEQTLREWMRRIDEGGERALVRLEGPVRRFPELVRQLVLPLKRVVPTMGQGCVRETRGPHDYG